MNKKIIIGTILVIFIILVGFFGYKKLNLPKTTTNQQEIENQTYRNQEHGFSIDIPKGWNYDSRTGRGGKEGTAWLAVKLFRNDNNETITIPIYIDEKNWVLYKPELLKEFSPDVVEETTFAGQPALKIVKERQYYFWIKHPKEGNKVLLGQATFIGTPVYVGSEQKNNNKNDGFETPVSENFQTSVDTILNSIKFE